MLAVDTNVLVRILIDDPKQLPQVKLARQFAMKVKKVYVPQIVQVELIWVLQAAYDLEKVDVLSVLTHLEENEAFVLQREELFSKALQTYKLTNADFSDCLIAAESEATHAVLYTFDRKLSRLPNVKALTQAEEVAVN